MIAAFVASLELAVVVAYSADVPVYEDFAPVARPVVDWSYTSSGDGRIQVVADHAASVTNEIIEEDSAFFGTKFARGNIYRASSNQFLTSFGLYLGRTNSTYLDFFVYESTAAGGVFTNIFLDELLVVGGTGHAQVTDQSIPMYAGRYYAIGVGWTNSVERYYSLGGENASALGVITNGFFFNSYNGTPANTFTGSVQSSIYYQKIVTTPEGVLQMDSATISYATNQARLKMNYHGYQSAKLSFRHRSRGDETEGLDGVYLATNTSQFVKILDLPNDVSWQSYTVDVFAAAASNAITLSSNTYIRFQQYDNWPVPNDGREFDDLRVYADADFRYNSLYVAPTQTFRGVSVDKAISAYSSLYEVGGDTALNQITNILRYYVWQGFFQNVYTSSIERVTSFAPYQNQYRFIGTDPVVPANIKLSNTVYALTGILDADGQLDEGSENNNRLFEVFRVNHYSGKLYFDNVETEITLTGWSDQSGFPSSPTRHVITGTGTVGGHPFAFTNLMVQKDLGSLDYTIDPAEIQVIHVAATDPDTYQQIDFVRSGGVDLSVTGACAPVLQVDLPAGAGISTAPDVAIMDGSVAFYSVKLDSDLRPDAPPVRSMYADVSEESKPFLLQTTEITWRDDNGLFELRATNLVYVREHALTRLEGLAVLPGLKRYRPSNEQFYRRSELPSTPVLVNLRAGSQGEALLDLDLTIKSHSFNGHMPYDVNYDYSTGNGSLVITGDLIHAASSSVNGVGDIVVTYKPGCNDGCPGSAVSSNLVFEPELNTLTFTPDGGLHAPGWMAQPFDLAWGLRPDGKYAQTVTNWSAGHFHAPGHFLRGDQRPAGLADNHGPGILLYTGVSTNGQEATDRFGTAAYVAGRGDYAGVNLRVVTDGAKKAASTLGNKSSGPYDLKGISKYYVRLSGVSGLHQSIPETFPAELEIYNYPFEFTNYGLNYLSNFNRDSVTEGSVELVYPSGFIQAFENLTFTCPGDLDNADIPGGVNHTNLVYWNAPLAISSMSFERNSDCASIGSGYLTFGIQTYAQHVTPPLTGKLGFFANGDIIPKAFGLDGVDSRLSLPASIDLDGPGDETYAFMPVSLAYFNTYTNAGASTNSAEGFVSFAGAMDVPFFQDLLVQFHVPAGTGTVGSLHMMGGWPDAGWKSGGNDFFSIPDFDQDNRAWPASAGSVANYRSQTVGTYLVRAKQSWLGLVDLTYPLIWSDAAKSFVSSEQSKSDVLVLSVEHQVDYLSAENAELSFGLQYGELPSINLANMVVNELTEVTGTGQAFINAVGDEIVGSLDNGLSDLDRLIDNQARALVDNVLSSMVDPIIDDLYHRLQTDYIPGVNYYSVGISNYVLRTTPGSVNHAFQHLADGVGYATSIVYEVDSALARVEAMLQAVSGTVTIDPLTGSSLAVPKPGLLSSEDFPLIGDLANGLLQVLAQSVVDALAAELAPQLDAMLEEVKPSLDVIGETSSLLLERIQGIRAELAASQAFASELEDAIQAAQVKSLTASIALDLEIMFEGFPSAHNPFNDYSEDEIKAMIRTRIESRLFGSPVMSGLTTVVRSWMYDIDSQIRQAVDSMFQQVNTMIREVVSSQLAGLDDSINGMLGDISDVMGTGQIDGYAHITGDSLKELRLDAKFQWKVPDEMEFGGYLLIKEIGSDGSSGCKFGSGGVANTVEIGADRIGVSWFGSDVSIDVAVKFTLVDGAPAGFGGALELASGTISFEAFEISDFGAAVMFGLYENYLAGQIRAAFSSSQVAGGAFFGRTCTLDPIELVDPDVADVLGTPPFSGIYVYGEAWIPIVDFGCLFNISAGVGAGFFYFVEGPTIGAKMLLGVSGEALCVVSVAGEVKLVGVKSGNDLSAKGTGTIKGKVGACPFCVKFNESVEVLYKNGSWDVNY